MLCHARAGFNTATVVAPRSTQQAARGERAPAPYPAQYDNAVLCQRMFRIRELRRRDELLPRLVHAPRR